MVTWPCPDGHNVGRITDILRFWARSYVNEKQELFNGRLDRPLPRPPTGTGIGDAPTA